MNPQTHYICCHRITVEGSSTIQQVISIHRSADFFIKPIREKQGDNVLDHEWYVIEVGLSYFDKIHRFHTDTPFDSEWQRPIATLKGTDKTATWNKEHPLYDVLVKKPQLSTTV